MQVADELVLFCSSTRRPQNVGTKVRGLQRSGGRVQGAATGLAMTLDPHLELSSCKDAKKVVVVKPDSCGELCAAAFTYILQADPQLIHIQPCSTDLESFRKSHLL